ncbi:hypothetical protein D3C85_1561940 [compost metagenome]
MPRSCSVVSGGLLIHSVAPVRGGMTPSTGRAFSGARAAFMGWAAPKRLSRLCSMRLVPPLDRRVSRPVSRPSAMAATPIRTRTPRPFRTHSPTPSDRFIVWKTLPPISRARAREVAAPAA